MATTVENILNRIQAQGYSTDVEAPQILNINSVQMRVLNTRRFEFMRGQASKTLTAGKGEYALTEFASDIKHVDEIRIGITSTEVFPSIDFLDYTEFRNLEHTYRQEGTPKYWTRLGNSIHFWPIPDEPYSATMDYIKIPTVLTAKANNIQIPDSHADILVWGTIMGLTFRERDFEGHNFSRQLYAELLAEMMAQYGMTDRQTAKHVQDSGFYSPYDVEPDLWLL